MTFDTTTAGERHPIAPPSDARSTAQPAAVDIRGLHKVFGQGDDAVTVPASTPEGERSHENQEGSL